jgi:hypothetical protein
LQNLRQPQTSALPSLPHLVKSVAGLQVQGLLPPEAAQPHKSSV